jgi:hypothetical protein
VQFANGVVIATPSIIFRGRMDQMDISIGSTAQVSVKLENRLTDWERPRIRRYMDADQRRRDPNDGSFRFVPARREVQPCCTIRRPEIAATSQELVVRENPGMSVR